MRILKHYDIDSLIVPQIDHISTLVGTGTFTAVFTQNDDINTPEHIVPIKFAWLCSEIETNDSMNRTTQVNTDFTEATQNRGIVFSDDEKTIIHDLVIQHALTRQEIVLPTFEFMLKQLST